MPSPSPAPNIVEQKTQQVCQSCRVLLCAQFDRAKRLKEERQKAAKKLKREQKK